MNVAFTVKQKNRIKNLCDDINVPNTVSVKVAFMKFKYIN